MVLDRGRKLKNNDEVRMATGDMSMISYQAYEQRAIVQ